MAVHFKSTSDVEDVVRDYGKLQSENIKLRDRIGQVAKASKDGKSHADSFAQSQLSQVTSMLTGWASIEGAVRLVGGALRFAREETEAALGSMDALADSRRRLAQVSLNGKDLDAIDKRADEMAAKHGVKRDVARNVVFDARSLGVEDSLPEIFRYSEVLDPGAATLAAGKLPSIFDGQINQSQAMNLAFAAARESALSFEDLMQSLPTAAQGVSLAGGSPTETAAIVSVLSAEMADKAEAGRLVKSFGVKVGINREVFPEKHGILPAVERLESMSPQDRGDFLKENQELNVAYQKILANMSKIRERQATLQSAVDTAGTVEAPLERARSAVFDPGTDLGKQTIAHSQRRRAEIRRDVIRENRFGESGSLAAAGVDNVMGDLDKARAGTLEKFAASSVGNTAAFFQMPHSFTEGATAGAGIAMEQIFNPFALFGNRNARVVSQEMSERERERRREQAGDVPVIDTRPLEGAQEKSNDLLSDIRDSMRTIAGRSANTRSDVHRETR